MSLRVLSLFDGYGGSAIALKKIGVDCEIYSSEVDRFCIEVSSQNKDLVHLGDINNWRSWDIEWGGIDLLMAGSPCQGFSDSGKGLNFDDPRSKLFFVFLDIRDHILSLNKDLIWVLENVEMKSEWSKKIDELTGVSRVNINASLVSPCYRPRNYWCNFDVSQPKDLGLKISDFVSDGFKYPASITGRRINPETGKRDDYNKEIPISQYLEVQSHDKARCVTTVPKDCLLSSIPPGKYKDAYASLKKGVDWREPTVSELERWHGVNPGYFSGVSESQARKMIGNGWNIDVICHILKSAGI